MEVTMEITAEQIKSLLALYPNDEIAEDSIGCGVQYQIEHGTAYSHFRIVLAPEVLKQPDVAALEGICGSRLIEQDDNSWVLQLRHDEYGETVNLKLSSDEMKKVIQNNNVILYR